ncbi:hypothetical protein ACFQMA_19015 [Halosimplex aquaticum]|uniref:Energy-coupling factor transport system substrate-specific component n=1 Tax=Halosimplex aquaticum TaxID=3026162 RepID=A0ABD5Y3J2_9EURY|nr:hypothetical protein [Halosimplex aquaticum]
MTPRSGFAERLPTVGGLPTAGARLLQLVIVVMTAYGAISGRVGVAVNGVLSLGVTLVPAGVAWLFDHEIDPRLSLWIAVAAAIHVGGFLGPYDQQTGLLASYDQVAHMVSAAFVAGVGYAVVEAVDESSRRAEFPEEFRFVFTLALVMAFGVAWEIGEFAAGAVGAALTGTEVLVQYGVSDIVADLTFNTIAAAAVALWGTGYFDGVAAAFSRGVFGD